MARSWERHPAVKQVSYKLLQLHPCRTFRPEEHPSNERGNVYITIYDHRNSESAEYTLKHCHKVHWIYDTYMSPLVHRDIPEPLPGSRHDTFNSQLLVFLLTVIAMSLLVVIWRRASSLKSVVQHRLKNLTSSDGAIRLPAEEGPPDEIFNEDEDLDADDEPLADRQSQSVVRNDTQRVQVSS